jgi:hypothetical protein
VSLESGHVSLESISFKVDNISFKVSWKNNIFNILKQILFWFQNFHIMI